MRDMIYELANENSQIICTTHSPYMIDLSQKPRQILNNLKINNNKFVDIVPFNVSDEFIKLQDNEKDYIKMLQKIDDYIARVFFAKHIIIVEGDTDELVLKKTIEVMPPESRNNISADFQIIKARGKAAIIPLVKYLKVMNLDLFVMHDRDNNTPNAEKFNQPILEAIGNEQKRLLMHECIEEELGYSVPTYEKPYQAYQYVKNWTKWDDVPLKWRGDMSVLFHGYV